MGQSQGREAEAFPLTEVSEESFRNMSLDYLYEEGQYGKLMHAVCSDNESNLSPCDVTSSTN